MKSTISLIDEVFQNLSVGIIVLNLKEHKNLKHARILKMNPTAERLLKVNATSAKGKTLSEFPEFSRGNLLDKDPKALSGSSPIDLGVVKLDRQPGWPASFRVRAYPLSRNRVLVSIENLEVEPAGRSESPLQINRIRADQDYRLLVQGVRGYAIYMLDPDGVIVSWDKGAEQLMGFRPAEAIGQSYSTFYTQDDQTAGKPAAHLQRAREIGQAEVEGWRVRKDGSHFWANALITALPDKNGGFLGFAKITRDITELKDRETANRAAREELEVLVRERTSELLRVNERLQFEVQDRQRAEEQLRALAARLQKGQEAERIRLAREIHDALGQLCTALKIDITFIARKLPKTETLLAEKAKSAMSLVNDLIRSLRQLSAELHPGTLQALGLNAAMEWQGQEFQRNTGIRVRFRHPDKDPGLDLESSTAVFRIFQESLTNVARHSDATFVQADISAENGTLSLVIHDNGKGFNAATPGPRNSLGLLGMQERAHLLGGHLEISSSPGEGTTIMLLVPLQRLG